MFELSLTVRDYECDIEGIVNNAVYQHYFEHARHAYLATSGFSFAEFVRKGIFLIIYRAEIDYLLPLKPNLSFTVTVKPERISKLRAAFHQEIFCNGTLYTRGKFYATAVDADQKPIRLDFLDAFLPRL